MTTSHSQSLSKSDLKPADPCPIELSLSRDFGRYLHSSAAEESNAAFLEKPQGNVSCRLKLTLLKPQTLFKLSLYIYIIINRYIDINEYIL